MRPLLLRRRAEEILELVDKTEKEIGAQDENIEGVVSIGCGDIAAVQLIPKLIQEFNNKYPHVSFDLYTATADHVRERMDRGLTDIGILLEPITIDKYDFVRLPVKEQWVAVMHPDAPLAEKKAVTAKDLLELPLIMPHRMSVQSKLANWFGDDYGRLQVLFTSNLPSNSSVMVYNRLAYSLIIKGSVAFWDQKKVTYRPLSPELYATSVIAWKRQQPFGAAAEKFIEYAREYFEKG